MDNIKTGIKMKRSSNERHIMGHTENMRSFDTEFFVNQKRVNVREYKVKMVLSDSFG